MFLCYCTWVDRRLTQVQIPHHQKKWIIKLQNSNIRFIAADNEIAPDI